MLSSTEYGSSLQCIELHLDQIAIEQVSASGDAASTERIYGVGYEGLCVALQTCDAKSVAVRHLPDTSEVACTGSDGGLS